MTTPFFVIGFQRSGTTLLRLMLDNHPDVAIPLDVTGLWDRYEQRLSSYDLTKEAGVRSLISAILSEERIRLWEVPLTVDAVADSRQLPGYAGIVDAFNRAYARAKGKSQWGDKDPGNILRVAQLDRWFPTARFVHIIRDGRDACLSHLTQEFGFDDLLACAVAWREEVWWVRQMGELLGSGRYLEVMYERLINEPKQELERVATFLELRFTPEMLTYHERVDQSIPAEKRHIWPLINEPPNKLNAGKWRSAMSPSTQICFEKRAGLLLAELGYDTSPRPWRGAYGTEISFMLRRAYRAVRQRIRRQRNA
jgi:Sulfotransferase family